MLTLLCLVLGAFFSGCGGSGSGSSGSPPPPPPNPVPTIISLNPNPVNAGGAAFTLTITGSNFVSSSNVYWNGSPRTATYSSSTQLQAQITAADIAAPGSAAVGVTNPSPGGGDSGSAEFTVSALSNAVPSVTSLSPSFVNAGTSAFILTVTGANFLPTSTIEWNGAMLSTTYLSETQLEAPVPTLDIAASGFADVVVLTPAPGGGASTPAVFTIANVPFVVSQASNDLVWDSAHQLIYLSVPSLASANGNTVAALNPFTGSITSSQFAGSEPDVLAVSGDNQFLYAALDGASSVQRFTLPDLVPDISYSLGADPYFGPTFAVDLQVAPGLSHTTAASRGAFNVSPYADCGMTIYDDGSPRPATSDSPGQLYDSLQWGSDAAIYAVNSEVTSFNFYVLTVDATGVNLNHDYQNEFSDFYIAIHYDTGTKQVYTDDGYVINPSNGQHVAAFQAAGLMIPDSTLNSAFFLGQTQAQFGTPNFTIEAFDLTTFAPVAEVVVPNVQGNPLRFIRWGTNGLAFNDNAGYVYILNSPFVAADGARVKTPQRYLTPVVKTKSLARSFRAPKLVLRRSDLNSRTRKHSYQALDSNPAPTIASMSPSTVVAGVNDFALTVTGTNFLSLSIIEWNGSQLPTEYVSSGQLQAQVSASDVASGGSVAVSVMTPSPGGGTSTTLPFTIVSSSINPVPSILSLYPDYAAAGSSGFTMNVNGSNFNASSVVYWNGSPRSVLFYSTGQLQVQVNASDIATAGYAQITVSNPSPGGGLSNAAAFQSLYQPTIVNQATNDMVWDQLNQVIYISIPSSAGTNANQVCVLNPVTAAITNCQTGSEPDVLAISDDSQFLYVGMNGTFTVQRFKLPGLIPDISFTLGSDPFDGPYYALDLQVAPGASHTTAVSKGILNVDPATQGGIAIFDDSTPRPTTAVGWGPTDHSYDSLQWGSNATDLYASDTENVSNGFDFYRLSVSSSGVVLDQDYPNVFWNPGRIHYDKGTGLVYSDDGFHALDPATGLPAGIFDVGGGWPMAPDSALNTVFMLDKYAWQENANFTIELFDMTHYVSVAQIPFSTVQNSLVQVNRFIRWGTNGLALNDRSGNVYLISASFLNGNQASESRKRQRPIRMPGIVHETDCNFTDRSCATQKPQPGR